MMERRALSILTLGIGLAALIYASPSVFFVVFAGVLFALFLRAGGSLISSVLPIGHVFGTAIFLSILLLGITIAFVVYVPALVEQADELVALVPESVKAIQSVVYHKPWLAEILAQVEPAIISIGALTKGFSFLWALGALLAVTFLGLFFALNPEPYVSGGIALLDPTIRKRAHAILFQMAQILRQWLLGRAVSMIIVGTFTTAGLWAVGIEFAPALGGLAAILGFVPNVGPVIAAVPAILLALPNGAYPVGLVVAVYVLVQFFESYIITPIVERQAVSLPPGIVLAAQLFMGINFGILGLAIASPLAAVVLVLIREAYVSDWLEHAEH